MPYAHAKSPQHRIKQQKRNTKTKIKTLVAPRLSKEEWAELNKLLAKLEKLLAN